MKNDLSGYISASIRSLSRRLHYTLGDIYDTLTRQKTDMLPPKRMIFVGKGDFSKIGDHFVTIFKLQAGLQPHHHVLDVGCGIGRMAIPLTKYINETGRYEGFDIVPEAIQWCRKNITSQFPNFNFQKANIYNKNYNPAGRLNAVDFKFPYPDACFDFVFLTSVFTHMLPKEIEHYISEISRVLKNDGQCLITFFLSNDQVSSVIQEGKSALNFKFEFPGFLSTDQKLPEAAICYPEKDIRNLFENNSLNITASYPGGWSGHPGALSYQDIIIARKR